MKGGAYLKHELELSLGHGVDDDLVEDLIELVGLCRADVDDLELQIVLQLLQTLKVNLELERREKGRRIVVNRHIEDMNLGHAGQIFDD